MRHRPDNVVTFLFAWLQKHFPQACQEAYTHEEALAAIARYLPAAAHAKHDPKYKSGEEKWTDAQRRCAQRTGHRFAVLARSGKGGGDHRWCCEACEAPLADPERIAKETAKRAAVLAEDALAFGAADRGGVEEAARRDRHVLIPFQNVRTALHGLKISLLC